MGYNVYDTFEDSYSQPSACTVFPAGTTRTSAIVGTVIEDGTMTLPPGGGAILVYNLPASDPWSGAGSFLYPRLPCGMVVGVVLTVAGAQVVLESQDVTTVEGLGYEFAFDETEPIEEVTVVYSALDDGATIYPPKQAWDSCFPACADACTPCWNQVYDGDRTTPSATVSNIQAAGLAAMLFECRSVSQLNGRATTC